MTKAQDLNQAPGQQLFQQASDFYSWFMSSFSLTADAKVFQILSKIMRIAKLSSEGGKFLSDQEEKKTILLLTKLKEQLCDGTLKKEHTADELSSFVHNIISSNPKAKVISYATELEYNFCILKPPSKESSHLKNYLEHLVEKVTPSLLEIQAYAISQIMGKILENPKVHLNAAVLLEEEIPRWLPPSQENSVNRSHISEISDT